MPPPGFLFYMTSPLRSLERLPTSRGEWTRAFKADKAATEQPLACFKDCVSSQPEAFSERLSPLSETK